MLCRERSLVKSHRDSVEVVTLFCKCWGCEICRPKLKAKVRGEIGAGRPTRFVTLTCRPPTDRTPGEQAVWMKDRAKRLMQEYRQAVAPAEVEYFAVVEAHKSGWPHIHLAVRAPWIDQAKLSAIWERLTGSYVVGIEKVRTKRGIAGYFVKRYLTKDMTADGWGKRFWKSQNYLPADSGEVPPMPPAWGQEVIDGAADYVAGFYLTGKTAPALWAVEEYRGLDYFKLAWRGSP